MLHANQYDPVERKKKKNFIVQERKLIIAEAITLRNITRNEFKTKMEGLTLNGARNLPSIIKNLYGKETVKLLELVHILSRGAKQEC